jgi:RimJ/RimL family protein N-acetyltransferase
MNSSVRPTRWKSKKWKSGQVSGKYNQLIHVKGYERIETSRLVLRRPLAGDASAMFERYASDSDVTTFVGWPRHRTVTDTLAFLQFSDAEWDRWPCGPYLIVSRADGRLLGGTGLGFEAPDRAVTGYVLARDSWGQGYATEALHAMVDLACRMGVVRLYAVCHPQHRASRRVLEKCDFTCEGTWRDHAEFPNLTPGVRSDVLCYALTLGARGAASSRAAGRAPE